MGSTKSRGAGWRSASVAVVATLVGVLVSVPRAAAQTNVQLPNTAQTTTFTAAVSEQARVTLPAAVTFNVTNINVSTPAPSVPVSIQNIVLATATKQVRIALRANASAFTAPVTGATTWSASDVSWSSPNGGPNQWVNAVRTNGSLNATSFTDVATCDPDVSSCSSSGVTLTLAAKASVKRSGIHTLTVTWKIESIGS